MSHLDRNRSRPKTLLIIYGGMFVFFLAKAFFYARYVGRFPDESDHISYIAYLEKTNALIPNFKNMMLLVLQQGAGGDTYHGQYVFGSVLNQLGHPPLYYQFMRLAHGVVLQNGVFVIHIVRLRLLSLFLASLGLLLAFYIGWTRIAHVPMLHLLYAVICTSVPMFAYVSAGVNNDTMAYVTFNLYLLGFLRYTERKTDIGTYLLISAGITLSLLTKSTAALVAIGSLALYLLYCMICRKDLQFFRRRQFWVTLPIYLVAALYLFTVKWETGSFQPTLSSLDWQQFVNSSFYVAPANRQHMDFGAYFYYFFHGFFLTWSGIASHVSLTKSDALWAIDQIGLLLLFVLPLFLIVRSKHGLERKWHSANLLFIYCTLLIVIFLQFFRAYWQFSHVSGYLGGCQSRYYLCAVPMLSLCITWSAQTAYSRLTRRTTFDRQSMARSTAGGIAVQAACAGFSVLLIYEDIIYFLCNFHQYL